MAAIKTLEVAGIWSAMHGMRMPYKSHDRSDTDGNVIGPNDMKLAKTLLSSVHDCDSKFMRMITVWADFKMPRYWWSEADTYSFVVKNSESTMHTLMTKDGKFVPEMFEGKTYSYKKYLENVCEILNEYKTAYQVANRDKDIVTKNHILLSAKSILPESFLQTRTVCTNYAELRNMYRQRYNHRLPEWNTVFVNWVKTLPYAEFITGESNDKVSN